MPFDLKSGLTVRHHHIGLAFILVILLVIVISLLVKPAFIGYKLSKQFEELGTNAEAILKEVEFLKSQLLITKTNLDTCQGLNARYLADLNVEKNATFACLEETRRFGTSTEQLRLEYQFNISQLRSEKEDLEIQLTTSQNKYELIIQNAADNICCKNRVDNPEIDSFLVSNDRIICAVGEETKISC